MPDWAEKYRPSTLSEVRGNDSARDEFEEWARTWLDHREAVILYGSPGVGKTSAAHALASDMGWPVIELNASDKRTADAIERYAGRGARNNTLQGAVDVARRESEGEEVPDADRESRQLIIVDEADNIHYQQDSGGTRAITDLVKEANQPMVLVANDFYEMSHGLRNACRTIEFRDVSSRSIVPVLRDVCRKEGVAFDEAALKRIADRNDGDLRGAVKDLQTAVSGGDRVDVEDVTAGERDRTKGIFEFLDAVLKEETPEDALRLTYDVDETPDDLLLWIEDKLPKVYEGDELARAYRHVARADRWLGRVRATQTYRYWRYATDNVAAGVASARTDTRGGWTQYGGAPYRSTKDATRDHVAGQVAAVAGVSTATARREILPYLEVMTHHCTNRELTVRMAARYDLDAEHVAFVTGSGVSTNKVQSIVEDAAALQAEAVADHAGDAFLQLVEEDAGGAEVDDTGDEGGHDQQVTLDDGGTGDDGGAGEDGESEGARREATAAEEAAEDEQQSGLSDFT